jgi:hypothetical protein
MARYGVSPNTSTINESPQSQIIYSAKKRELITPHYDKAKEFGTTIRERLIAIQEVNKLQYVIKKRSLIAHLNASTYLQFLIISLNKLTDQVLHPLMEN